MRIVRYLLVFCAVLSSMLSLPQEAIATSVYSNCIESSVGESISTFEYVEISPFNLTCQVDCNTSCKAAFIRADHYGELMNLDTAAKCVQACRTNLQFKAPYYQDTLENGSYSYKVQGYQTVYPSSSCSSSEVEAPVSITDVYVEKNRTIKLALPAELTYAADVVPSSSLSTNKLYMCGYDAYNWHSIFPKYGSQPDFGNSTLFGNTSYWTSNPTVKKALESVDYHTCLYSGMNNVFSSKQFSDLSNVQIANTSTMTILYNLVFQYPNASCSSFSYQETPPDDLSSYRKCYLANKWTMFNNFAYCKNHSRNNKYPQTNIYAKNGDYIKLTFTGYVNHWDSLPIISKFSNSTHWNSSHQMTIANGSSSAKYIAYPWTAWQTNSITPVYFQGEALRKYGKDSIWKDPYFSVASGNVILGLAGSYIDRDMVLYSDSAYQNVCTNTIYGTSDGCDKVKLADPVGRTTIYKYSGYLSGFSSDPRLFSPRVTNDADDALHDNSGSRDINIEWGGCAKSFPNNLQYAIYPSKTSTLSACDAANSTNCIAWYDVPSDYSDGFSVPSTGYLAFRIKADTAPSTSEKMAYVDPTYRYGSYQFLATIAPLGSTSGGGGSVGGVTTLSGPLYKVLKLVQNTLYGSGTTTGTVASIFKSFVVQSQFKYAVQSLLVMFIAFYGVGFLLGTVKAQTKEMLGVLLKFSFIAALISDTSWNFFNDYFLKFFYLGSMEMVALLVKSDPILGSGITGLSKDPALALSILDTGLNTMFFDTMNWKRLGSLLAGGLLGIVMLVMILLAMCFFYFLSVLRIFVSLLMSQIVIAIFILIAPIIIPMSLFSLTRQVFDYWWKYMLGFAIQPVALFSSVLVFNSLIMYTFYTAIGFTICEFCFLSIDLNAIGINYVWCVDDLFGIQSYMPLSAATITGSSSFNGISRQAFMAAIILLFLSWSMYSFTGFIGQLVTSIVQGRRDRIASPEAIAGRVVNAGGWMNIAKSQFVQTQSTTAAAERHESMKKRREALANKRTDAAPPAAGRDDNR